MSLPVVIKSLNKGQATWIAILDVFKKFSVTCNKLESTNDGFKAFLADESDVDKVFTGKTIESFEGINCIPLKPGYFRTKRTVIVQLAEIYLLD